MLPNFGIVVLTTLIPIVMGFIYYNPKVLGGVWMRASGMDKEKMKGANMLVIFGGSLLLSFLLAFIMFSLTVHQTDIYSLHAGDPGFLEEGSYTMQQIEALMQKYGENFRTFKHGALHGSVIGLFVVLPIMGTNALFERKGGKYIFVNVSYWVLCLALMGGVLCQWG